MEGGMDQSSSKKKKSADDMLTVYDNVNSAMLMFNLTEKTLFAMNINAFRSKASQEAAKKPTEPASGDKPSMTCNKTGKTKTIMSYSCAEYICKTESETSYTAIWVYSGGKIIDMPFGSMLGAPPVMYGKSSGINGAVMGIDSYQNGEKKTSMEVTNINEKESLNLATKDFKRQEMPTVSFGQ